MQDEDKDDEEEEDVNEEDGPELSRWRRREDL
jgi:hypothetical protein